MLGQAVVFGSQSSMDENPLDLFSVFSADIARVVSISAILTGEVNDSIGRLSREKLFGYSRVDSLKLFRMCGPVRCGKEELLEGLLRALGDELSVSEGFVVTVVVDEGSHVDQDLVDRHLIELGTQGLDSLPWSLLECPQNYVKKSGGLI